MYEIIIKKKQDIEVKGEREYKKIADTGGDDGGSKYGYVDRPPYTKKDWVEVFKQQADTCNIVDVVAAFNNVTFNK